MARQMQPGAMASQHEKREHARDDDAEPRDRNANKKIVSRH
jgi:hypothetical protein